MQLRSF